MFKCERIEIVLMMIFYLSTVADFPIVKVDYFLGIPCDWGAVVISKRKNQMCLKLIILQILKINVSRIQHLSKTKSNKCTLIKPTNISD